MEIKDRILKIMSSEGLNSSLFADNIGVQRSSISHILSGRNKPSIDFLEKIFKTFPKYNAEWLIMGTGEIYKKPIQSTLFDLYSMEQNTITQTEPKTEEEPLNETKNRLITAQKVPELNVKTEVEQTTGEPNQSTLPSKDLRQIERVIIFYNDKTFTEYNPL